jgi:hypothetical protein
MAGRVVFDTTSLVVRLSKRLARSAKVDFGRSILTSRSTRRRNGKLLRPLRTTDKPSNPNTPTIRTTNTRTAILQPQRMEPTLDQAHTVHPTVRQHRTWHDHLFQAHSKSPALTTLHTHRLHQVLPLLARLTAHQVEDRMLLLTLSLLDQPAILMEERHNHHRHNLVSLKHRRSKAKHLRRRRVNHSNLSHNPVKLLTRRQDSLTSRRAIKLQDRLTASHFTLLKVNRRLPDL